MQTAGLLVGDILDAMDGADDHNLIRKVWNTLRIELNELCKEFSVAHLRDKVTIDFSDTTYSTGMVLPADLLGIDMVRDSDGNEYIERDRSGIAPDEWGYRFYRYHPSLSPLFMGTDLGVTNEGTSFTSPTLETRIADTDTDPDTVIDEYVQFGEGMEFYKVSVDTSPFSFTPTYYGDTISDGDVKLRPAETQRMVILDEAETALVDKSVDIFYWKAPLGIYRDSDVIPLSSANALMLRILRRLPEAKLKRPVSATEIDKAMAKLKALNPRFPRPPHPRDKHNRLITSGSNMFGGR